MGTDWADAGIPAQDAFVAEYVVQARLAAPLAAFHIAFAMFRFAVIFAGIADRARAGSAAQPMPPALAGVPP